MNLQLYAKVKQSARYCRDVEVRKKISLFLEVICIGNVELACKRMGVHRASYYRWWNRFCENGFDAAALKPKSRCPKRSPRQTPERIIRKIRHYRFNYRYGPESIQDYLALNHNIQISQSCIYRIILKKGWILRRYRTKKKNPHKKRYELPAPGFIQISMKRKDVEIYLYRQPSQPSGNSGVIQAWNGFHQ